MAVGLAQCNDSRILEVDLQGKLDTRDYEQFVPEIERLLDHHEKLRLLVVLRDFHGWTTAAPWEDVRFDLKRFSDIERLALIGDGRWQEGMTEFCRPFTTAEIRYFHQNRIEEARRWIAEQA